MTSRPRPPGPRQYPEPCATARRWPGPAGTRLRPPPRAGSRRSRPATGPGCARTRRAAAHRGWAIRAFLIAEAVFLGVSALLGWLIGIDGAGVGGIVAAIAVPTVLRPPSPRYC